MGATQEDLTDQLEAEEEAEFEAEFVTEEEADHVSPPEEPANTAVASQEPGEPETPSTAEPTPPGEKAADPGEEDRLTALEKRLDARLNGFSGVFGKLKSDVQAALAAKKETQAQGGEAPTAKEIKEAHSSSEKLSALKEDFPEWSEALDEQFEALEQRITSKVNPEGIQENLSTLMDSALVNTTTRLRQVLRVDMAYPSWEADINTDEFKTWKAGQAEDVQALADSPLAKDAIKMLDAYAESKKSPTEKSTGQKSRLAAAVAPTRGAPTRQVGTSDEDDFLAGFNEL